MLTLCLNNIHQLHNVGWSWKTSIVGSVSLLMQECLSKATCSLWLTQVPEERGDVGVARKYHVEAEIPVSWFGPILGWRKPYRCLRLQK